MKGLLVAGIASTVFRRHTKTRIEQLAIRAANGTIREQERNRSSRRLDARPRAIAVEGRDELPGEPEGLRGGLLRSSHWEKINVFCLRHDAAAGLNDHADGGSASLSR